MTLGKRMYWVVALVAVLALAGAAVTLTARLTSAGSGSTPTAQTCDQQDQVGDAAEAAKGTDDDAAEAKDTPEAHDGAEAKDAADTDNIEQQCGPQDEGNDANETHAAAGQLDDGADLLPQAAISVNEAIAAAQSAASGALGEVDLEHYQGKLVFNIDIGDKDVKVDASNGTVLAADLDD